MKKFIQMRFKICFSVLALLFSTSQGNAQKNTDLSIAQMHKIVETLVNYSLDSSLVLLDAASNKINQINDQALFNAHTAENNIRRADYWILTNPKEAKTYAEQAYSYFRMHPNNKALAEIFTLKAQLNPLKAELIPKRLAYLDTAQTFAERDDDNRLIAFIYYERALTLQRLNQWQESIENAFKAIDYSVTLSDSLTLAASHYLIGRTYGYFGFVDKSEENLQKAVAFGKGLVYLYLIVHRYADVLIKNNKSALAIAQYQSALQLYKAGAKPSFLIITYAKIGQAQLSIKDYTAAANTLQTLENFDFKMLESQPRVSLFKAEIFQYMGENQKALQTLNTFFIQYESGIYIISQTDLLKTAARISAKLNLLDKTYQYYEDYISAKDSINTYNSKLQLEDLEQLYNKEKSKNEEIALKNTALEASRSQRTNMAVLLILALLLGGSSFFYIKTRSAKEKQVLLLRIKEKQLEQCLEAQEIERQRLGRELHDGIGQSLAALKMQLQFDGDAQSKQTAVNSLETLCKEVRSISHHMMPLALEQNGLLNAMEQLLHFSFRNVAIQVDFVTHGIYNRFPQKIEIHLYRIVQELISNILKHAKADKVGVQILKQKDKILLIVEDNGCGFSKDEQEKGIGLSNIKSRLITVSGKVKIETSAAQGTYVRVVIPLEEQLTKQTA